MINTDWGYLLKNEFEKEYFLEIMSFLEEKYEKNIIYPPKDEIFRAFDCTTYEETNIVILGQDPYHQKNQADGLAFSVKKGEKIPPSLKNIYQEIFNEYGGKIHNNGDLTRLANQGVLLLNTTLTVQENQPNSHENIGWKIFTDAVINLLNNKEKPVVFILWGKNSIKKEKLIIKNHHLVLTAPHPSPLSAYRGFLGCDHFKLANDFLRENNLKEINWLE